jgi:hypothetical protein
VVAQHVEHAAAEHGVEARQDLRRGAGHDVSSRREGGQEGRYRPDVA